MTWFDEKPIKWWQRFIASLCFYVCADYVLECYETKQQACFASFLFIIPSLVKYRNLSMLLLQQNRGWGVSVSVTNQTGICTPSFKAPYSRLLLFRSPFPLEIESVKSHYITWVEQYNSIGRLENVMVAASCLWEWLFILRHGDIFFKKKCFMCWVMHTFLLYLLARLASRDLFSLYKCFQTTWNRQRNNLISVIRSWLDAPMTTGRPFPSQLELLTFINKSSNCSSSQLPVLMKSSHDLSVLWTRE